VAATSLPAQVAVIGNGIMGHGLAEVFAVSGTPTTLIGRRQESLNASIARIEVSLARFTAEGLMAEQEAASALTRITPTLALEDAAGAELVIEAVTEDVALKEEIFKELDRLCPPPAVLASSSGQPISNLTARVEHRERTIATHFWNPPQLIPLVEVCASSETDPAVVPWVCGVLERVGKQPVVLEREIDGFIGNRLQFALLREAVSLWASGVASAEAIDQAVKASFGRRLSVTGPLESADIGGLETMEAFARFLFPDLNTSGEPPPKMAQAIADAGADMPAMSQLSGRTPEAVLDERMAELFRQLRQDQTAGA